MVAERALDPQCSCMGGDVIEHVPVAAATGGAPASTGMLLNVELTFASQR